MWGLWLFPLIAALFFGTLLIAALIALVVRPKRPAAWAGLIVAPFGCAALPLLALFALAGVGALLQKSDARLFQEIYGFIPDMDEGRMLSDDFGIFSDRWIYMRLEPSAADRQRILDVSPRASSLTPEQFANYGATHDFTWWDVGCDAPDLRDASGYRDWQLLITLDCPANRRMFIVAYRP